MRILYVTLGIPDPPRVGPQLRDFELYRRIAARHEVQVVALAESAPTAPPREDRIGRVHALVVPTALRPGLVTRLPAHLAAGRPLGTLPFVDPAAHAAIGNVVRTWLPDVVQFEHSFLAPYVTAVPPRTPTRTVLSLHNLGRVQYARMRDVARGLRARTQAALTSWSMRGWEARWCARFDRVVVVSDTDRAWLLERDPALPIHVVPNGVDTKQPPLPPPRGHGLLFVGNLAYGPNVDAVHHFCDAVLPLVRERLPQATFEVVGFGAPPSVLELARHPGVTIVGGAPDVEPHYLRAAVSVVPLRAGGGTRLKILEAMALGRPVVSTTVGCEGLDVRHGEHLIVADDASAFARAVIDLCLDANAGLRLVSQARRLVEERYDWDTLTRSLDALYHEFPAA